MSADENDSEGNDSGPGRRETAQRLFAAEFEDATFSYAESDEERAPNYVVAPSGARVNRLFAVGVLTEVEAVSENVLRGRIVDPTGAFVTYAGQYQPDALAFLERTDPPAFVAVTGKARTFEPEDSDVTYTSVRPETMNEVDAETRDRWVVNAAERTHERIETLRDAKARAESGDDLEASLHAEGVPEALAAGAPRALEAYGTTDDYLDALADLARDAVGVVAGQREEAGRLDIAPGEGEDRDVEPVSRVEEEAGERESREPDPVGTEESAGQPSAPEPAEEPGETVEEEAAETGEFDEPAAENIESDDGTAADADSEFTPNTEEPEASTEPMGDEEPEPTARVEEEPDERESELGDPVGTEASAGQPSTPEPAEEPGETAETEAAETDEFDDPAAENVESESGEEPPETDEMYEFDDEERQQVEEEHGLEFSTGSEVEPAEELGESAPEEPDATGPESGDGASEGGLGDFQSGLSESEAEEENDSDGNGTDFDDPEGAAVEAMADLGDGGAVERDALVAELVSRHGVSEDEADDAIEEALMSGRCYESGDDELTPI